MKILAIGGSNSKNSINRALANFTAQLFIGSTVSTVDISLLTIPIYSIDNENDLGIPNEVTAFANQIDETDLIILSLAENNGSFNVGIKNILDWTSRIKDRKTFNNKPMLLMATSPGARGGTTVLESAKMLLPFSGADIKATFSLPSFYQNFDLEKGITNVELLDNLKTIIKNLDN
ncbi:NAD(P)H-dependent oxidoreductase [Flavobacterium branchiophilum]|uniref:NADPH-dependent FMN reductase n=1 Tax=Flavobacterium branchiophilum (strain FL-15) TaxID=1034807 RepID=G2Z6I1_FLABF|nr:NAD(P)H-dependent oxidoreductase [Flavobacterium branchiophilum]CCB71012.1 NADPH-dependent FMN reductase [Flavobacterium branchiophilum FL-15]